MQPLIKLFAATTLAISLQASPSALTGIGPAFAQAAPDAVVSEDAMSKINTYVDYLNQTLRASESLERYDSWVDMEKGPTGKEDIIYGLYALYDVRGEASAVTAATQAAPTMSELDAAMQAYVEAYQQLAPVIERANKYYERQDYKGDNMEAGKGFHREIVSLAPVFEERRKKADAALRDEKVTVDLAALAGLEKVEGKTSRWHLRNVMFRAEAMMDLMPSNERPIVDMTAFSQALNDYATAVRGFDDYSLEHPSSFSGFNSWPASLLSKLRSFGEQLEEAKGDARQGAGEDLRWVISDYNTMVTMSETATIFDED